MAKRKSGPAKSSPIVDPWKWAQEYLPPQETRKLSGSLEKQLPISIRINQLKSNPKTNIEIWKQAYQWDTSPTPFCSSGFWIVEPSISPSSTIEHRLGYYYIQEAASMLPAELFDFDGLEHPLILDMAASPGGKTIHLVDRIMDKGLIIANDASRSRIPALRIILQNWGAINQAITNIQGEWYGQAYPDSFDAVLLDAPCSMQGLRTSPSHKMCPITENEIESLADRQFNLIESALQTVKIGGQVVYSTCTLSPYENEGVVSRILEKYPGSIELEDIQHTLPTPAPAITQIGGKQLQEQVKKAARIWPHIFETAGFFCAKFIKQGIIPSENRWDVHRNNPNMKGEYFNKKKSDDLTDMISSLYGFNLQCVIADQSLSYWQFKENIFLVPSQVQNQFPKLPVHSMGMLIGKYFPKGWQPSHEFVSRFGDQFTENIYVLGDEFYKAWLRGEDIRNSVRPSGQIGKFLAIRDASGRNLGRGKMLSNRLRNMLPTRLF